MIKLKNLDKPQNYLVIPKHKLTMYALTNTPERLYPVDVKDLDYNAQKKNVEAFLKLAKSMPTSQFYITSSFSPAIDFAPMFALAPRNCFLPLRWVDILGADDTIFYWNG